MSKFLKKHYSNILFIIIIGLLLYTPTRVYFIRLISFAPSKISTEKQLLLKNNDWQLKGLNTDDINLKDLENKVAFVSFWATWCPPCIAELPSIQKLYNDYNNKITFLLVTNEDWKTVSHFYTDKGYDLPTYNSITQIPAELKSNTIPTTFIISKEEKIIVEKKGSANWNSDSVRELLDELSGKN